MEIKTGSASTLADDLVAHPDLIPLLDLEGDKVVCFGWVSPIYEFDSEILNDQS